jgi:hypothetical protein
MSWTTSTRLGFGYLLCAIGILAGMAIERHAAHIHDLGTIHAMRCLGVAVFAVSLLFSTGLTFQRIGSWLEAAERIALRSRQRSIFLVLATVIAISIPVVMKLEPRSSPELPIAGVIAIVMCLRTARGYTDRERQR